MHAQQFLESVSCILPHICNVQIYLDYLQNSSFLTDIEHIVGCFDKTTKLRFRNSDEPQYIKFGGTRDNDPSRNIRFGQLKLLGSDVAKFFEPSVECIVNAVLEQCRMAHKPISVCLFWFSWFPFVLNFAFQHVVLAGGLAANDWLFNEVHQKLLPHGLNVVRPQNHVSVPPSFQFIIYLTCFSIFRNKAVSDGALSYYHDHFVFTRVSKFTYGVFCNIVFNPADPDHQRRFNKVFVDASGTPLGRIGDAFYIILLKVCLFSSMIART